MRGDGKPPAAYLELTCCIDLGLFESVACELALVLVFADKVQKSTFGF